MIPKVKAYEDTHVSANKTRFEIEEMLEKKFGVTKYHRLSFRLLPDN